MVSRKTMKNNFDASYVIWRKSESYLRPVALVLLFITFYYYDPDSSFGSESNIVQTGV